jgi:hypothetical protein
MNLPAPPKSADDAEQPGRADRGGVIRGGDDEGKAEQTRPPVTRKQLDDIFGDVLPTVTQDELDDRDGPSGDDRDGWYRDNRPPHHG